MKLKEQNNCRDVPREHSTGKESFLDSLKESPISFWIDSSGGPSEHCNLSFYGTNLKYYLYGFLNEVNLYECDSGAITFVNGNCFDFLEEKLNEEKKNKNGIFVGYFSYDLFQRGKKNNYPDFFFAYFDDVQDMGQNVIARSKETLHATSPQQSRSGYVDAMEIASPLARNDVSCKHLTSNITDSEYLEKVRLIKDEIKAGNVYQVNLTREYSIEQSDIDELAIYLKLRDASPNPYGCFFKTPFVSILSSSPEEFLFVKDGYIRTRPIKGTLPKYELNIDLKNQAENIMIVDLERNDLGRVCEYGSIIAKKLLDIESYKHLNHVVSTIEGKLRANINLKEIFMALFPSGSITGAPKIAAMKIIDKIEPTKRGAYTGSFGYIRTDGTMNFNILIRTMFIHNNKITFNVGGGIVADSEPESELEEIRLKAKGIMSTLGIKAPC
ncbi:MAG: anthranilate synthase component I family protein [Candidatus Melainabacteria bacterium]|nr:anthranilate synthase component I family protein [Candidatus Melainabacteria bacterium]